jgi:hypothetical protein
MNAEAPSRYHSSINLLARYAIASIAIWSGNFWALFPWLFSANPKGGGPFFVFLVLCTTMLSAFMLASCILLAQFFRIPALGRLWFASRAPATAFLIAGHLVFFTCFAITAEVPERLNFPTGSAPLSFGLFALSVTSVGVFGFGFAQFPFLRRPPSLPTGVLPGLLRIPFAGVAIGFAIALFVAIPVVLIVYLTPPTKPPVAGTYIRSAAADTATLILKPDGTFHQTVKYARGKTWELDGAWELQNIMVELDKGYEVYDFGDQKELDPPQLYEALNFQYEVDQLARNDVDTTPYKKTSSAPSTSPNK